MAFFYLIYLAPCKFNQLALKSIKRGTSMKTLILCALTLAASSSFAMPTVGDSASYDLVQTMSGQTVNYSITETLTGYDAANKQFSEASLATYNGQSSSTTKVVLASKLLTDAQVTSYVAGCTGIGGVNETITVPAGTFNTCKVSSTQNGTTGTINVALVAFGIVRYESSDATGNHFLLTLTASHIAQ
jgi:hypothetical protein